jgi:hypothetical protein
MVLASASLDFMFGIGASRANHWPVFWPRLEALCEPD